MAIITYVRRVVTGQYEHKEATFTVNPDEHGLTFEAAGDKVKEIVHRILDLGERVVAAEVKTVVEAPIPLPAAPPIPVAPPTPPVPVSVSVAPPVPPPVAALPQTAAPAVLPSTPALPSEGSSVPSPEIVVPEWSEENVRKLLENAVGRLNAAGRPGNALVLDLITKHSNSSPPRATRIPEDMRLAFVTALSTLA